jgi:hypothetical protein
MGLGDMHPPQVRPVAGGRAAAREPAGRAPPWSRSGGHRRLVREEKGLEDMRPPRARSEAGGRAATGAREFDRQRRRRQSKLGEWPATVIKLGERLATEIMLEVNIASSLLLAVVALRIGGGGPWWPSRWHGGAGRGH